MAAKKDQDVKRIPALEWLAASLGLLVVAGMLAFLALQAMSSEARKPPLMRVEPLTLTRAGDRYVLEVEIRNASQQTGAAVQIEGALRQGGTDVETSNATLSYVPGQSQRRAGLIFTHDPRRYQVELRVTGYEQP